MATTPGGSGGEAALSTASERSYYCGALAALRCVEARLPTGRRFGAEAAARWRSFKGDLTTADRIDLLIRDADAQWPGAFAARRVFARRAVAEDEPFGVGWDPLDPIDAEDIWRSENSLPASADVGGTLAAVALHWGITTTTTSVGGSLGVIHPADKLVVAGPSAIAATLEAFQRGKDLDWADQVIVVATPLAHRQLAALGSALLNVASPTRVIDHTEVATLARKARVVVSDDANADDARRARELGSAG